MKKYIILAVLALSLSLSACDSESIDLSENEYIDLSNGDNASTDQEIEEQLDLVYEEINESEIDFDSYDEDNENIIPLLSSGDVILIEEPGTYLLEGMYTTTLVIDVEDEEDVNLVLKNATLTSEDGPCIIVLNADDVTISVPEGTESSISDTSTYSQSYDEEELDAVIYSTSDLEFNGLGVLNIYANYNNAIHTKDDVKISELTLYIESVDDGIVGKDFVAVKDATITVNCDGDGIKATNLEESNRGFIYIESGTFTINALNDGIEAVNDIIVYDGTFTINATYNGFESNNSIYLGNGQYTVTSNYDAINAVEELILYDGTYVISAGDDALHSDNLLTIDGGSITIEESYEGIEAYQITINGGTIVVNSSDDAVNATTGGGQQHGTAYVSTGGLLYINGGIMQINATSGDGIDVNGSAYMTGGYVLVYGTSADNQAAIDFDKTFEISGGTIIAIGSTGMIHSLSSTSAQASLLYADSTSYNSGTTITLYDEDNNKLLEVEAIRSFTGVVISLEELTINNTYTLELDDDTYDFEVVNTVTSIGDGGTTMTMPNRPGGTRRP